MKTIPIFFTFDNNYTVPAAIALYSLLNKAKDDVFYKMHILHSDITEENQKLISNSLNKFNNFNLEFNNTKGFLENEWNEGNFDGQNSGMQFTADTLLRCFPARFFPQYDKIIYSDVDIVVVEDISDLYEINIDNQYIAAVKDAFMKWDSYELSHLSTEHYEKFKDTYFAGGIWVMNLKKIREDNLEDKMFDIIKDDTIIKRWNDMDIMNIACDNNVYFLPLNYIAYPYLLERILKSDFISDFSQEQLYDSIINPKIIHYAGIKPWNGKPNYNELWWNIYYYLDLPKTTIFKIEFEKKNKYKKYKILFNIFLILSLIFLALNLLLLLFLLG